MNHMDGPTPTRNGFPQRLNERRGIVVTTVCGNVIRVRIVRRNGKPEIILHGEDISRIQPELLTAPNQNP